MPLLSVYTKDSLREIKKIALFHTTDITVVFLALNFRKCLGSRHVPCSSSSSTMTSKYWLIASKTQALSSIWTDFFGLVGAGRSTELCCSDLQIESPPKVILGVSNMFWIAERFSSKDLRSTSLTPNNHWYQSCFLERLNAELVIAAVSVLTFFPLVVPRSLIEN